MRKFLLGFALGILTLLMAGLGLAELGYLAIDAKSMPPAWESALAAPRDGGLCGAAGAASQQSCHAERGKSHRRIENVQRDVCGVPWRPEWRECVRRGLLPESSSVRFTPADEARLGIVLDSEKRRAVLGHALVGGIVREGCRREDLEDRDLPDSPGCAAAGSSGGMAQEPGPTVIKARLPAPCNQLASMVVL